MALLHSEKYGGLDVEVEVKALEFAHAGHDILESKGIFTQQTGAWDTKFVVVTNHLCVAGNRLTSLLEAEPSLGVYSSELSLYEVYYLNNYVIEMNRLMDKADFIPPITNDPNYDQWLNEFNSARSSYVSAR